MCTGGMDAGVNSVVLLALIWGLVRALLVWIWVWLVREFFISMWHRITGLDGSLADMGYAGMYVGVAGKFTTAMDARCNGHGWRAGSGMAG
jgi:hypothetical protein